jgi:2,4-dichlorophenol 6-monooxygenase
MALVLDGHAGPGLLDSYTAERQPVGAEGVNRAITSFGEMAAIETAMGFEPGQTEEDGWAALAALDEPGPAGAERRRALRDAVSQTDYQFNAHGLELGYVYASASSAVASDPTPAPEPAPDAHLHYRPTTRPGARVPHARLELGSTHISTLDLVDGLGFALLTGPGGEEWAKAAAEVATKTGVPIAVHVIGRGTGGPADPYGEWERLREVESDGAVLVRPDRHVAWRYQRFDATGRDALHAAVDKILARDSSTSSAARPAAVAVASPT